MSDIEEIKSYKHALIHSKDRIKDVLASERKILNALINEIEKIRSKNNVNWMDILRLAFKYAPDESYDTGLSRPDLKGKVPEHIKQRMKNDKDQT